MVHVGAIFDFRESVGGYGENEDVDRKVDESIGCGVCRGHCLASYRVWMEMMGMRLWTEK